MKEERVLKMAEFLGFFSQDPKDNGISVRRAIVQPLSCSFESSFYSLCGAIIAGDHGGSFKTVFNGNMVVSLFQVSASNRKNNFLDRGRSWALGSQG